MAGRGSGGVWVSVVWANVSRVPHITWRYLCLFIRSRKKTTLKKRGRRWCAAKVFLAQQKLIKTQIQYTYSPEQLNTRCNQWPVTRDKDCQVGPFLEEFCESGKLCLEYEFTVCLGILWKKNPWTLLLPTFILPAVYESYESNRHMNICNHPSNHSSKSPNSLESKRWGPSIALPVIVMSEPLLLQHIRPKKKNIFFSFQEEEKQTLKPVFICIKLCW